MMHCWHATPLQHGVVGHLDVYCCWCEKEECLTAIPPPGHGPYAPDDEYFPDESGECLARKPPHGTGSGS